MGIRKFVAERVSEIDAVWRETNMHRGGMVWVLTGMLLAGVGCSKESHTRVVVKRPRPVSTLELHTSVPRLQPMYAGSVTAWKSQDVGFEVGSRVLEILEPGINVEGPSVDPATEEFLPHTATVIGKLDPTRYQVRLASAQAGVATAQARLNASDKDVRDVMPKQIRAAEATVQLAQQEYGRAKNLIASQAATQTSLDKAKADLDTAEAQLQQLQATVTVKEAERASYAAQLNEAQERVRQAQQDLDDTILYAPFQGQIATVYETVGSVVQAGQPVLKLQMMDPIQIDVQVSAATDATLLYNDVVWVYPPEDNKPVQAMVYEKAAVADAATRTFLVTLLIRNEKIQEGLPEQHDAKLDIRTRTITPLMTESRNQTPPYYARETAIYHSGGKEYVFRIKGLQKGHPDSAMPSRLDVEAVPVRTGNKRIPFLKVATLIELTDLGDLNPETDLLVGEVYNMNGSPLSEAEAFERLSRLKHVHFVRERWRFRPGDIAKVDLQRQPPPPGFYLPMDAISLDPAHANQASVFVIKHEENSIRARQVPVKLLAPPVANLRRIEALNAGELTEGDRVVNGGVHYLRDGDEVLPTTRDSQP